MSLVGKQSAELKIKLYFHCKREAILYFLGFSPSFSVLHSVFVHVKLTNSKEGYSVWQKTLLLNYLQHHISSPAFASITYLRHYVKQHHLQLGERPPPRWDSRPPRCLPLLWSKRISKAGSFSSWLQGPTQKSSSTPTICPQNKMKTLGGGLTISLQTFLRAKLSIGTAHLLVARTNTKVVIYSHHLSVSRLIMSDGNVTPEWLENCVCIVTLLCWTALSRAGNGTRSRMARYRRSMNWLQPWKLWVLPRVVLFYCLFCWTWQ